MNNTHDAIASDMRGKVALVTGATGGIGKVTARELARKGATVVGVSRSAQKCAEVEAEIRHETANPDVSFIPADLSARAEVRRVAEAFKSRHNRLDVLVNNVGGVFGARAESVDGIELTWALNHLSYFLLTDGLMEVLKATSGRSGAAARVVNVSSDAHRPASIGFADLEFKTRRYAAFAAYSQSKLANVLFTYELARRTQGTGVTANALHPGFVATGFGRSSLTGPMAVGLGMVSRLFARTPERGAGTSIYLACSPAAEGVTGRYFADSKEARSSSASYDTDAARRLWDVSLAMCA